MDDALIEFQYKKYLITAWAQPMPAGKFVPRAAFAQLYGSDSEQQSFNVTGAFATAEEAARHALGSCMNYLEDL